MTFSNDILCIIDYITIITGIIGRLNAKLILLKN